MIYALIGGAIIGLSVSLMLLFNGRVTGISGIVGGILTPKKSDFSWRLMFILGLITGGVILGFIHPQAFNQATLNMTSLDYAIAGILVGLGTTLGSGCTSGHGVCGISRLSVRSIIATVVFIVFGMISVLVFKSVKGEI